MSHQIPRQAKFLLRVAIPILTVFLIVACGTQNRQPTSLPPVKKVQTGKIAQPVKIAKGVKTAEPVVAPSTVKVRRRVKTTEPTSTSPTVPVDIPTDVAADANLVSPPNAGLPKGAGQPPRRLVIPKMSLDTGIQDATLTTSEVSGQAYADFLIPYDAVGHLAQTANPGELGNMVISGHHNLIGPNKFGKGLFGGLWDLQVGDAIYVFDEGGRAFDYAVSKSYYVKESGESFAVREEHAREILADTGEPVLTLITCWNGAAAPYSGNTYRWVIAAHLVNSLQPDQVPVLVPNPTPMQ